MSIGKILISIARFGWKKIIKPAAVEYGPGILADTVRRRQGRKTETRDVGDEPQHGRDNAQHNPESSQS